MTHQGGAGGRGNVFSVGINGSGYHDLYDFSGGIDGRYPDGDLLASAGTLFGTTSNAGANGYGTVFALAGNTPTPGARGLWPSPPPPPGRPRRVLVSLAAAGHPRGGSAAKATVGGSKTRRSRKRRKNESTEDERSRMFWRLRLFALSRFNYFPPDKAEAVNIFLSQFSFREKEPPLGAGGRKNLGKEDWERNIGEHDLR